VIGDSGLPRGVPSLSAPGASLSVHAKAKVSVGPGAEFNMLSQFFVNVSASFATKPREGETIPEISASGWFAAGVNLGSTDDEAAIKGSGNYAAGQVDVRLHKFAGVINSEISCKILVTKIPTAVDGLSQIASLDCMFSLAKMVLPGGIDLEVGLCTLNSVDP
jgi:hypothetical protein